VITLVSPTAEEAADWVERERRVLGIHSFRTREEMENTTKYLIARAWEQKHPKLSKELSKAEKWARIRKTNRGLLKLMETGDLYHFFKDEIVEPPVKQHEDQIHYFRQKLQAVRTVSQTLDLRKDLQAYKPPPEIETAERDRTILLGDLNNALAIQVCLERNKPFEKTYRVTFGKVIPRIYVRSPNGRIVTWKKIEEET